MSQSSGPVADVAPVATAQSLQGLIDEVGRAVPRPVNVLQVTALLETAGVTEAIAQHRYGYADIFALAEDVATGVAAAVPAVTEAKATIPEPDRKAIVIDYLRGPFSLLPLVVLTVMINVYQSYGQWHPGRVFILSVSTIGSLLVTGGFVQVLARKGSIYLSQGYVRAARQFLGRVLLTAMAVVVGVAVLLAVGGVWTGLLDLVDVPLMLAAFVMLSSFWLLAAVLSVLSHAHWFGLGLGIGAAASYLALLALRAINIQQRYLVTGAAAIGYLVCVGALTGGVRWILARQARNAAPQRVVPPPRAQMLVALAPYFVYGIAYLLNVLAGHVGGWIGRLPATVSRSEAVATSEIALTVALTSYMLVGGVAEHTMQRFWQRVNAYQVWTPATTPHAFGHRIEQFYLSERERYALVLAFCTAGVVVAMAAVLRSTSFTFLGLQWTSGATLVLMTGMLGYGLLALGVFDCMLLITLSQPRFALEALSLGLVTTLGTSLLAGVAMGYAYGALGTVLGSLAFLMLARSRLQRLLRDADYYYYASF
ncbi:MAG: hypothetical protein JXC32_16320 [Anaerolineae bacterium]|nr:hypothetical protein [Anaerolineae bacterium]